MSYNNNTETEMKPAIGDRDMADKKVNYTEAQVAAMVNEYQAGVSVEDIAEAMTKSVRSVRAKLVREGVYVAPEKPVKAKREEGPSKKELLNTLEALVPFDVTGLGNSNKESLAMLIAFIAPAEAE